MLRYATSNLCRTRLLLTYFGYGASAATNCGICDNCVEAAHEAQRRADDAPIQPPLRAGDAPAIDRRQILAQTVARRHARSHRARALTIERPRPLPLASHGLDTGDVVRHKTWGEGEIVRVEGETVGAFFPAFGEKRLKASYLEKVRR